MSRLPRRGDELDPATRPRRHNDSAPIWYTGLNSAPVPSLPRAGIRGIGGRSPLLRRITSTRVLFVGGFAVCLKMPLGVASVVKIEVRNRRLDHRPESLAKERSCLENADQLDLTWAD